MYNSHMSGVDFQQSFGMPHQSPEPEYGAFSTQLEGVEASAWELGALINACGGELENDNIEVLQLGILQHMIEMGLDPYKMLWVRHALDIDAYWEFINDRQGWEGVLYQSDIEEEKASSEDIEDEESSPVDLRNMTAWIRFQGEHVFSPGEIDRKLVESGQIPEEMLDNFDQYWSALGLWNSRWGSGFSEESIRELLITETDRARAEHRNYLDHLPAAGGNLGIRMAGILRYLILLRVSRNDLAERHWRFDEEMAWRDIVEERKQQEEEWRWLGLSYKMFELLGSKAFSKIKPHQVFDRKGGLMDGISEKIWIDQDVLEAIEVDPLRGITREVDETYTPWGEWLSIERIVEGDTRILHIMVYHLKNDTLTIYSLKDTDEAWETSTVEGVDIYALEEIKEQQSCEAIRGRGED